MARRVDAPRRGWPVLLAAVVGVVVLGGLGVMVILGAPAGSGTPTTPPATAPSLVADASLIPSASTTASPAPSASPHQSAVPTATPEPSVAPSADPTPTPAPAAGAAPTSATGFDLHAQVIDIGFPLRSDTTSHYRDNWLDRRPGPPDDYNHARVGTKGDLVRLHDGIDIYAPEAEPVLSPFDGVVIDPATRWSPWEPDRYGLTVVVESDEPTSPGYTAVLVHLDRVWVDVGQHVTRGQVIGDLGKTGNAENVRPQLHFELRAPFLIDWSALGENRLVDAFNPYPSLVASDPSRAP